MALSYRHQRRHEPLQAGPPEAHFETFASKPPQGDSVTVCHAYGCKAQTSFTFTPSDISELDRSQQDCVDEATKTTSYLLVLTRHGVIRHDAVERPFAKDDFGKWRWAALIREKQSGELFAVDSSASANGENPTVQSAASFYVPDSSADVKPPETWRYASARGS